MNLDKKSFGMLFGGQGTQYKGMCSDLVGKSIRINEVFETASAVLGIDVIEAINTYSMKQLTFSDIAQPLVVTASCAAHVAFTEEFGVKPDFMCGHSLGEISALICSGAIGLREGIDFVKKRGVVMSQLASKEYRGSVGVVLDISLDELEKIIADNQVDGYTVITAYNSTKQFLVAGEPAAMKTLENRLDNCGAQLVPYRMIPMRTDAPYHSKLAGVLADKLAELTCQLNISSPEIPVYSTVTGELHKKDDIAAVLVKQLQMPVLWMQTLSKSSKECSADFLLEVGPGNTMRNNVRATEDLPICLSYDDFEDKKKLIELLGHTMVRS